MTSASPLPTRNVGKTGRQATALGLGLMGLSASYGFAGTDEERFAVLDRAWEIGCTNWDTSDGYGDSEDLLGKWFKLHPERRADIFLASKFGIKAVRNEDGSYDASTDTSPAYTREACEQSLKRLGIESIDLYYIHRLDNVTPVEKTIEVLAELKKEGKIKGIGISECSSRSLRRAYAIAPIDAVQMEYSPWQLDIENETGTYLLKTCRELGVTVFAYAPLGRGFLTGQIKSPDDFAPDDFRRFIPRFSKENFASNLILVDVFKSFGARKNCAPGQLALAWLMAQGEDIIPIPGTKKIKYLEENMGALQVHLSSEEAKEIRDAVESAEITGHRNPIGFTLPEFADSPEL
ncbi:Aldo/keto reductase [Thozetella sp. PMI_491]|nr:Aldo/keto reductase [Thozetella sp. PMI_491]